MDVMRFSINEKTAAFLCVLSGITVATTISPSGEYFLGNFIYFWLPQLGILALTAIIHSRPAVISGAALVMALYLAAFNSWTPDSMAWLGYLFSLPGAAIGSAIGAANIKNRATTTAIHAGSAVAASTIIGLSINQLLVCSTVMHCAF
ncbi:hypothetical protein [Atopomonas hussainii]|uniref:hypothetical protein n=1 Tax=Atopomonas hussainii TaxID=1429083 RepID=UPI00111489F5|nr:hypothetical protein [Atopomonas hussainii]